MIRFLLSLFRPFRTLIERSGVDYEQFICILELKLTLDNRHQRRKQTASSANNLMGQSIGQIVVGLVFAMMSMFIQSEFTFYYLMHSIIMVMIAMLIISEFTTVLFDTSENSIILPLPIKSDTLSLARNAHVFLYLMLIAFNISLATIIIGIVKFGIASGVIFIVSMVLNVMFTLFLSNLLYLGLMRIASGERLKNVLMYFQIGIAVLSMAGYQFGMNMIDRSAIMHMTLPIHWYTYLVPPAIFSGFIEALSTAKFDASHLLFLAEAVMLPIIVAYITSRYLTPVFNRKLLNLETSDKAAKVKSNTGKSSSYFLLMEKLFTRNQSEKAAFQLTWRMSGNERLFKQSFFPSLAYVLIMFAVLFFKKDISLKDLALSHKYLIILYSFMLISFTLTTSLLLGNNNQAEWIFRALPSDTPADYFKGFIKAVFARFFNPFYVLISAGVIAFWGATVIPDIIIVWLAIYLSTLLMFYIGQPDYPFSQAKNATQGGKNGIKVFALMLMAGILGIVHYFLCKWRIVGPVILILVYISGILLTNRIWVYKLITWKNRGS